WRGHAREPRRRRSRTLQREAGHRLRRPTVEGRTRRHRRRRHRPRGRTAGGCRRRRRHRGLLHPRTLPRRGRGHPPEHPGHHRPVRAAGDRPAALRLIPTEKVTSMELTASVLAAPTTPTSEARVRVVLPPLGTSVGDPPQQAATELAQLSPESTVIGIDLPGHGRSGPIDVPAGSTVAPRMTVRELAEAVLSTLDRVLPDAAAPGTPVDLAGDSIGGAIALQLA